MRDELKQKNTKKNMSDVTGKNTADTDDIDTSNDCENGFAPDSKRKKCWKFPLIATIQNQWSILLGALEDYSAMTYDLENCDSPIAVRLIEICDRHGQDMFALKELVEDSLAKACKLGGKDCKFDWPSGSYEAEPIVRCYCEDGICPIDIDLDPEQISIPDIWHHNEPHPDQLQSLSDTKENKSQQDEQGMLSADGQSDYADVSHSRKKEQLETTGQSEDLLKQVQIIYEALESGTINSDLAEASIAVAENLLKMFMLVHKYQDKKKMVPDHHDDFIEEFISSETVDQLPTKSQLESIKRLIAVVKQQMHKKAGTTLED